MKILFNHFDPFSLAHGGFQVQIEQTKAALESIGVQVEWLRWWDDQQKYDLIHHFGTVSNTLLLQAKAGGKPVVLTTLFTETCNRSDAQLFRQKRFTQLILGLPFGEGIKRQLTWQTYGRCAQNIVGLECERQVLEQVYQVARERISVVPLGLSQNYLQAGTGHRSQPYLICTGTITARKNCIALAEMAQAAKVPILFIGKPYHPADEYWLKFQALIDSRWVHHHPHVKSETEMKALLQDARGFVLMSNFENWCLSAHEAIACGLPILVQRQKWSTERFGDQAWYFSSIGNNSANTKALKRFYLDSPSLKAPSIEIYSWEAVARRLCSVYEDVLSRRQTASS
jgi:glycosyltransferase involved in cell wall biosynthesis